MIKGLFGKYKKLFLILLVMLAIVLGAAQIEGTNEIDMEESVVETVVSDSVLATESLKENKQESKSDKDAVKWTDDIKETVNFQNQEVEGVDHTEESKERASSKVENIQSEQKSTSIQEEELVPGTEDKEDEKIETEQLPVTETEENSVSEENFVVESETVPKSDQIQKSEQEGSATCSHSWIFESYFQVPDCSNGGLENQICAHCGEQRTVGGTPTGKHDYIVETEGDCCSEEIVRCSVCNNREIREKNIANHIDVEDGSCYGCGQKIESE